MKNSFVLDELRLCVFTRQAQNNTRPTNALFQDEGFVERTVIECPHEPNMILFSLSVIHHSNEKNVVLDSMSTMILLLHTSPQLSKSQVKDNRPRNNKQTATSNE